MVVIDYSNSPFARPDLRILVEGDSLLTRILTYAEKAICLHTRYITDKERLPLRGRRSDSMRGALHVTVEGWKAWQRLGLICY